VSCGIHYPNPVHLQKAYAPLGLGPGSFPVTEKCAGDILSLPMFPELSEAQIAVVVRELTSLHPASLRRDAIGA
jgi:dTDP-4-amino-4,6-dideoxygalactose transaminase